MPTTTTEDYSPDQHLRSTTYKETSSEANFLSPTRFVFVIDDPNLKNISYNCQTVSIPSVSAPSIPMQYRQMKANMTSTDFSVSPFTARFIIDESMENYEIVYKWLVTSVIPSAFTDASSSSDDGVIKNGFIERDQKSDVTLLIYNNHNVLSIGIQMVSCFPTELTPVEFVVTNTGTEYLYADITFSLDYYLIKRYNDTNHQQQP